jgi:molybdenum cofactor biosynthesis protein B
MVDDRSGETLVKRIGESGHMLVDRRIVRDDIEAIVAVISAWCQSSDVDVVISTGGTGLTGRDVTVEAHRRVYEKEIDGFSTLFHMVSAEKIGTSTMQSRACGGVCNGVYLFALPGSPSACKDGWDQILRWQLDHRHRPCNLVEIMPRLIEGR